MGTSCSSVENNNKKTNKVEPFDNKNDNGKASTQPHDKFLSTPASVVNHNNNLDSNQNSNIGGGTEKNNTKAHKKTSTKPSDEAFLNISVKGEIAKCVAAVTKEYNDIVLVKCQNNKTLGEWMKIRNNSRGEWSDDT